MTDFRGPGFQPTQTRNGIALNHQRPPYPNSNGLATTSLVLSLVGFMTCGLTSLLAVIFGHVALSQIKKHPADNRSMAMAGTVLGWFLTVCWILWWILVGAAMITSMLGLAGQKGNYPVTTPTDISSSYWKCLDKADTPEEINACG